ncbi:MAG: hypothetical protein Q4G13_01095 [Moraxella sp.]|nr:hypothetical protein [Moraxella sp.]
MVDISKIDLGTLDKEHLEKVKLMLDINKIQSDIESTRQSINESQARARHTNTDIEQIRQSITESQARVSHFNADIEQIRQSINESQARTGHFNADMEQIRQSINESQARSRQADATLEQIRITVKKMEKENNWYPWLQITTTLLTGGIVVFFLTYFLK